MTLRALTVGCCFGLAAALTALPLRADDGAAPAIIDIAIAPQPVLGGQQATTTVATTNDVTTVEARVAFMRIPIPRVGPGVGPTETDETGQSRGGSAGDCQPGPGLLPHRAYSPLGVLAA